MMRRLLLLALVAASCGGASVATDSPTTLVASSAESAAPAAEPIELSLSLYIVEEVDDGNASPRSSDRTEEELADIAERIQGIWTTAGVRYNPVVVSTVEVPTPVMDAIIAGDARPFLESAGTSFAVPDAGIINGFYVPFAGGANGFTPLTSRVFFVTDEPSVLDERVSSHEIGHILGLRHEPDDPDRLMFSGTNGMALTETEITVSRYTATGILNGTR